jgi:hypothetical protein
MTAVIVSSLAQLSDTELLTEVPRLAARERHATARLIASLAELDASGTSLGRCPEESSWPRDAAQPRRLTDQPATGACLCRAR